VVNNTVIARSHNLTELLNDVTAHAEMQSITAAAHYLGEVLERLYTIRNTGALPNVRWCFVLRSPKLYMEQVMFSVVFSTMGTKLHPAKKPSSFQEFMANGCEYTKAFVSRRK
jgi:tRNA(adenine34) deaminase